MLLSEIIDQLKSELDEHGDVELEASRSWTECLQRPTRNFHVYVYDPALTSEDRREDPKMPYELSFEPGEHL